MTTTSGTQSSEQTASVATIHKLPPPKRLLTELDAQRLSPLTAVLAKMSDDAIRQAFNALAEESRRRGMDQMIVDRASEIGLERMAAGDLEAIAKHMDGGGSLGGVA